MRGGILEVLLVGAEGFKHLSFLGRPRLYAVLQCGSESCSSKITSGRKSKVLWNEKIILKLPASPERSTCRLSLKILEKDMFTGDTFLGEATIRLEGIIVNEAPGVASIKPTTYNIVCPDGDYKGEIKVGLKFISELKEGGGEEVQMKAKDETVDDEGENRRRPKCGVVSNLARIVRQRLVNSWRCCLHGQ